jgi:uncharacterized MAPEG superfamily protein
LRGDAIAMTTELRMLAFSIVLGFVHIILASHAKSNVYGYRWSAGPRDQTMPPLPGVAGRLDRALRNFGETFPLFAAAVLVAQVADRHNAFTLWGGAALSLGACRLSPALRLWRVPRSVVGMERGCRWHLSHSAGPSLTGPSIAAPLALHSSRAESRPRCRPKPAA